MKNRKGFTLIELLAVIVILGILMMAAIPAITRTIAKSRRNTYWQNAKQYIKAATTPYLDGEYESTVTSGSSCNLPGQNQFVVIPQSIVELEQGSIEKSSFNSKYVTDTNTEKKAGTPVIIVANIPISGNDNLQWFYTGMDEQKNGIKDIVNMNQLNLKSVTTGSASSIKGTDLSKLKVTYSNGNYTVTVVSSCTASSGVYCLDEIDTCK